ncbi:hypothetical protein [Burkholderia dolosa]|uniref:hypothetical protein n=1 Tax=Burkholderia dolosa TaxID=152500 RepID=UPI0015927257|nr:hypothetical protein [Burkholderia dolosa]MBY4755071.1 hypothetical protein [Burkholderia dolosa]
MQANAVPVERTTRTRRDRARNVLIGRTHACALTRRSCRDGSATRLPRRTSARIERDPAPAVNSARHAAARQPETAKEKKR